MEAQPWYKSREPIIAIFGAFFIGMIVGLSNSPKQESATNVVDTGEIRVNTPEEEEAAKPFEKITLSGTGQKATDKVRLPKAMYSVKLTHDGRSNFIVVPYNSRGERDYSLVNDQGPFDGSKVFVVESDDEYIFDVAADGAWTIEIAK